MLARALVACAFSVVLSSAGRLDGLVVKVALRDTAAPSSSGFLVTVSMINAGTHPVFVHPFELPSAGPLAGQLFSVTLDTTSAVGGLKAGATASSVAAPVAYFGTIVKRGPPRDQDRVRVNPGSSLTFDMDLATLYDFSASGVYTIAYYAHGCGSGNEHVQSEPIRVEVMAGGTRRFADPARALRGAAELAPEDSESVAPLSAVDESEARRLQVTPTKTRTRTLSPTRSPTRSATRSVTPTRSPPAGTCGVSISGASGTYAGTTAGKASPIGTSCGVAPGTGGQQILAWTAPSSGTVFFSTCGGATWDTQLFVGTSTVAATCPTSTAQFSCVATNDDATCSGASSTQSKVSVLVTSGTTYYILVTGYTTSSGTYTLTWGFDVTPTISPTPSATTTRFASPSVTATRSAPAGTGGLSFSGGCTNVQQSDITTAVAGAKTYASGATTYLARTPSGTTRYTTWFGTYSLGNWNSAATHYTSILSAFNTQSIVVDCSCTTAGTYAYVYPASPYKIYVCGAFWSAPQTGTDSKAGTLIHEMSHFTIVVGTQDYQYGQTACKSLAISSPSQALMNADTHEYFAENTPTLAL